MVKTKVVKEKVFGDCTGAIYIDLVHEASETILNAETLYEFSKKLYHEIYRSERWDSIIVCFNDHNWFINDLNAGSITDDLKWFKIYHEYDVQFCDQIEIVEEEVIKREIFNGWSDTCADIYSKIVSEIGKIIREPKVMKAFCDKLYNVKEESNIKDFYISANFGNFKIGITPIAIDDPYYGTDVEPNHFYHYVSNGNASFVEIEWKGEKNEQCNTK